MPDQLSLFPTQESPEDLNLVLESEQNAIDEMFLAGRLYRSSVEYFDLIHFIARLPKYSAFNGLLLYLQNRNITYVSTAGNWQQQFGRRPKFNARPLIILAPMSPIRFVYDIYDTEGETITSDQLKSLAAKEKFSKDIYEKTISNCKFHGIAVRESLSAVKDIDNVLALTYETRKRYENLNIESWAKYLIFINLQDSNGDKYARLALGLGHIFCGHLGIDDSSWWQDRRDADQNKAAIEAQSAAYLVCLRKGLIKPSEKFLSPYNRVETEMPAFSLNAVFHATHYIEDMGKNRWKAAKRKSRYKQE